LNRSSVGFVKFFGANVTPAVGTHHILVDIEVVTVTQDRVAAELQRRESCFYQAGFLHLMQWIRVSLGDQVILKDFFEVGSISCQEELASSVWS
jgi:hypothetical protein